MSNQTPKDQELKNIYTKAILSANKTITQFDIFLIGYQASLLVPNEQQESLMQLALELKDALEQISKFTDRGYYGINYSTEANIAKETLKKWNEKWSKKYK